MRLLIEQDVVQELHRRKAIINLIDTALDSYFVFDTTNRKVRIRKSAVHRTIEERLGLSMEYNARDRKIVVERLKVKGAVPIMSNGAGYFMYVGVK